jgi:hypothetical protein
MKSLINAVYGKLLFGIILLGAFTTANAQQTANARQVDSESQQQPKKIAAAVNYLGTAEDTVVFDVSYPNPQGTRFQLTIKDQDGFQLYQDYFSDKSFHRQFRIARGDKEKIAFVIRDNKGAETGKTFLVNISSRLIREVAVKKIN